MGRLRVLRRKLSRAIYEGRKAFRGERPTARIGFPSMTLDGPIRVLADGVRVELEGGYALYSGDDFLVIEPGSYDVGLMDLTAERWEA